MYAVIRTGGKQYRVRVGDRLRVERLDGDTGDEITFDDVLCIGEGTDLRAGDAAGGASVTATITGQGRGRKVVVFKRRRRKNHRRTRGHRQHYTEVAVTAINGQEG
ncbi:MAG: 50S ribosomal protein L21 [Zetaproteobacteria bacterium]|nr:MAG: 50S ribosomal protein L21 [Zetaproteobacteria bacterium]